MGINIPLSRWLPSQTIVHQNAFGMRLKHISYTLEYYNLTYWILASFDTVLTRITNAINHSGLWYKYRHWKTRKSVSAAIYHALVVEKLKWKKYLFFSSVCMVVSWSSSPNYLLSSANVWLKYFLFLFTNIKNSLFDTLGRVFSERQFTYWWWSSPSWILLLLLFTFSSKKR